MPDPAPPAALGDRTRSHTSDDTLLDLGGATVRVRPLGSDREAAACATIMVTSDPWVTLGRTYERALAVVRDPEAECYVAVEGDGEEVVGFLILMLRGAFTGYIRTAALRADRRGSGLGSALIAFAERRIFRESPNVFLCVSSFNERARALYLRLGYEVVGELRDYLVRGHSEWLLRKSIAPIEEFRASPP